MSEDPDKPVDKPTTSLDAADIALLKSYVRACPRARVRRAPRARARAASLTTAAATARPPARPRAPRRL